MSCVKYEDLTEANIIELCKQRDSLAFDELVSRNKETLFNYILSKTKDQSTAHDILQITLVKAWNNIKNFEGRARILSWLTKIAFNAYYDYYKKAKREISLDEALSSPSVNSKTASSNDSFYTKANLADESKFNLVVEDPFKESKIKNLGKDIQRAINSLSKEHKEVLELRELYGLDCKQISQKINCPYPTVCTRLFYARKKAKVFLKNLIKNG